MGAFQEKTEEQEEDTDIEDYLDRANKCSKADAYPEG